MSAVGMLHPEELLDKAARGAISAAERELLAAHLAKCATCRVEQQLRDDFADELDAPMERPSLTDLLAQLPGKTPRDATPVGVGLDVVRPPSAPPRRSKRPVAKRAAWLIPAAAMLAVSVAAASTAVGARVWTRVVSVVTTHDVTAPAPTSLAPARAVHASAPHATAVSPVETSPSIEASAPPQPAPVVAPAHVAHVASHHARVAPPRDAEAAAMFDAASVARRHGEYARALSLHRDLAARFPRSREAQTGRAVIGRLLLDRGDPSGALASFDSYLAAGSGELGEEAMAGRATALERLGRSDDARRAWEALLAAYPTTPYAAHARARVAGGGASER